MMRNRKGIYTMVAFLAAAAPRIAFGAGSLNPFPIIPQSGTCICLGSAPDWGCILQVLQNVINGVIELGIILCVIWIAYGGFSMMISGGSAEARSQAKTRLLNAVVGIAVILCSWLLVDWVMKVVYEPSTAFEGDKFGPWNSILASTGNDYCIKPTTPSAIATGTVPFQLGSSGSSAGAQYAPGAVGGSCSVPASGACSVTSLQSTCFGGRADEAARVCNLESAGGRPTIESGSDKLNSGSGPSYSIGLWQINLTTSKVGGLDCPSAFTTACQGGALIKSHPGWCSASVIPAKQDLYNQCVAAAKVPANNYQAACQLYSTRGFQPWSYSANKCSVPFK